MTADHARRAHAIFTVALDRPHAEREAVVVESCGSDEALASRVWKLLAAAQCDTGFLESPVLDRLHAQVDHQTGLFHVPDAVGNYLVVGVLGAGGMATVYEAIQENPSRRVALKVMHLGLSHTDASARFRLETETLARLRHPGIAQIYEAGTALFGQSSASPFFAMELVEDALPLTDYARRHAMPLRTRLLMFASVCDAVLHGHQQGIIHRDLKPGNVLVGSDGQAKVIDFGIARAIGPRPGADSDGGMPHGASETCDVDARRILGTLNYMSPEQCTDPARSDVRTDVYSLGVILYELVTGQRPHDVSGRPIPEAFRIIAEEAPPRPSTLCRDARGDLDAIIGKAMEKDPARRYVGAAALAADVRRWLAFRPVEARPSSALEQVGKFVRRNPPLAATLGVLALTLALGALLTGRYAYLAAQARDAALVRERELETVTEFQESLLDGIDVAAMGDALKAAFLRELERAAARIELDGARSSPLAASVDLTERVNFTTLAVRSLNESILQRYRASIDEQFVEEPRLRARLLQQLASTMHTLGLHADAEPVIQDALAIRRTTLGEEHDDTLQSLHSLGSLLATLGRYDEAIPLLEDAYAARGRVLGADHFLTLRSGSSLGGAHRWQGNLSTAERIYAEVLAAQRRVLGDDHADTLRSLNNLGVAYASQQKLDDAEVCWRELTERRRRILGEDHPDYLASLGNLAVLYQDTGRVAEAGPMLEQVLAINRRRFGDRHSRTLLSMSQLAAVLQDMGELERAEALQRECLEGRRSELGAEHPATLRAMAGLASILVRRGALEEALAVVTSALDVQRRLLGDDHPETLESVRVLAEVTEAEPIRDREVRPPIAP